MATSRGDYARRLDMPRNDEFGILAAGLDKLMKTITNQTSSLAKMNEQLAELADTDQLTQLQSGQIVLQGSPRLENHIEKGRKILHGDEG